MRSQLTSTTQSAANRYFFTSLLPYFLFLKLRRPRRLHLRRRRPFRPRSRLMPHAPHRRRKPSARWHRIPSRLRVPDILPFAQKIQHERNRREQQQQIYERTRREVHCVVKNPGQQQDHSYDYEHGASNHPRYRRSNNPLFPNHFESRRVSTFAGPEEILRRAALCSIRCLAGNLSARNPGRDAKSISGGPARVRIVRNRQNFSTACIGLPQTQQTLDKRTQSSQFGAVPRRQCPAKWHRHSCLCAFDAITR